jgi:hypothetical protein
MPGTQVLAPKPFVPASNSFPNAHLYNQSIDYGAAEGGGGGGGARDLHFQEDTRVVREGGVCPTTAARRDVAM